VNYKNHLRRDFNNDIRCISHILNLAVQDILRDYLASEKSDFLLSNYIDCVTSEEELVLPNKEEFTSKLFLYILHIL
jgi:hypothetical protein